MKRWIRPRTVIALLAAIAAGLLVAMLPPLPDWTAPLPAGSVLREVSSDGRYLITSVEKTPFPFASRRAPGSSSELHVWDRAASMEEPMIAVPVPFPHYVAGALLAPDERTVAVTVDQAGPAKLSEVSHVDLATGKKVMTRTQRLQHLLFSRDGNLLFIQDGVLRELDNNREVRRWPKDLDEFAADQNLGE
jgi:hypothetical protein